MPATIELPIHNPVPGGLIQLDAVGGSANIVTGAYLSLAGTYLTATT